MTREQEIRDAYLAFWEANLSADMEAFASCLVDDFSIFGTANGEEFFNKEEAVRFYTATSDQIQGSFQLRNRDINVQLLDNDNAVVHERSQVYVLIENEWTYYGHSRITCIIRYIKGDWKAVHQHASFPDHRTEEGEQIAPEKIAKENLELREAVKRRTVELEAKNRELEIEAAVERVRAQSMAMQQTADIARVNEELYTQISKLNIDGFTGVAFYLVGDDGMVTVWDLSSPGSMGDVNDYVFKYDPERAPELSEFIPIWKEGKQDYFILSFPKERLFIAADEMEPFYPAYADYVRNAVNSGILEHQWNATATISDGILSLDMMKLPDEEVKSITLKMAAAFNLAYQRFKDLQNAEAQTREAQIEAGLERVRSGSLAMHHTSELQEVIHTLHKELLNLNIAIDGGSFIAINSDIDTQIRCWGAGGTADTSEEVTLPLYEKPFCAHLIAGIKNGPGFFTEEFTQKEKKDFFSFLLKHEPWSKLDAKQKKETLSAPGGYTRSCCVSRHTSIFIINHLGKKFSAADNDILKRFAKVFEQAYTRFLDLQKAEAQSRESQIQLALERVRARTMAMQHSDELADASFVLDSQVRALGIKTWGCAFNIYGDNESTEWFSSEAGMLPPYKTPREDFFLRAYEAGQSGQPLYIEEFAGEDCKAHYEYLCTIPIMGDAVRSMIENGGSFPERQIDHATFFKYGYLLFISMEPVPEAHDIFVRFANVFEQTYTRFLDLQKAEAQTLQAEQDLIEIKAARKKAENTLIELQATQKQLIQSEKMASLGELTAGIAHEIQNPLNFVNNFSEVSNELIDEMNDELDKGDVEEAKAIAADVKQNLEKINHHGKRADAIVKGMLQHSRTSSGQKELTDINALCDEYLRLAYHGLRAKDKSFNATLKTDFDETIGKINLVPQDIGRVVLNLITNAFYAVTDKQRQAVNDNYEPTVTVSTKKANGNVIVSVEDNGNGIPEHIRDKIFQPFFTTKPTGQGTGLGLSMSYDIVTKGHGGELKVETGGNDPDTPATTFIIRLPF